ncbi:lasso peptide biosynthesis B2 protein [Actinokineospora bangkokensis]|uniref:Microcin J25-processing protein McjB C-terminal domain-containing protein n=1 Tax=Actinokineospora bangkokensis TaxID=1193682 RepID=A0A1Q9LL99_9PSEU|nr:lasso peptide biosynthesis B2 protein [Actinokineospora bangkokensis]OLR92808.1 hypothetical protein BJP25_19455 [Actinokineospora bangkokensis]
MTTPVSLERASTVPPRQRVVAVLAVAVARALVALPPARLRQALRFASAGARRATAAEALRARTAVVTVSRRCAGQQCLQRSVATALLCRARGAWPTWQTGVRTEPFTAHAWVSVDGVPIGEAPHLCAYTPIMVVGPR